MGWVTLVCMTSSGSKSQPIIISESDVENEIVQLFGSLSETGLVIRVHGGNSESHRNAAFRELLESLKLYDFHESSKEIAVEPPDAETIATALSVLSDPALKRRLFERILLTFGRRMVDPLGEILDTTPGGALLAHMTHIRANVLQGVRKLRLTHETQAILIGDLEALLTNEYLTMLAEHEENVQRPRVTRLAQQILHLIGTTFERAFRQWPHHAKTIANSVSRRMGSSMSLRESPMVIRDRIVDSIEEFLWIETSTELSGAIAQLFGQDHYRGIFGDQAPALERDVYREFAEACWEIISQYS